MGLLVKQLAREQEMRQVGHAMVANGAENQLAPPGLAPRAQRALLAEAFFGVLESGKTELISAIADQLNPRKPGRPGVLQRELGALQAETIAYCALRVLLNEELSEISQQSAAIKIGEAVAFEARLARVRSQSPELWAQVEEVAHWAGRNTRGSRTTDGSGETQRYSAIVAALHSVKTLLREEDEGRPVGRDTLFQIGNKLLQLLLEYTDLFEVRHNPKRVNVVDLSPEAQARVFKRHKQLLHLAPPYFQPMIVPPKPWASVDSGGYLSIPRTAIKIREESKFGHLFKSELGQTDLGPVLEPLNLLQETGWRINVDVLTVMRAKEIQGLLKRLYSHGVETSAKFNAAPDQPSRDGEDKAARWIADKIISEVTDLSEDEDEQGYRVFSRIAEMGEAYCSTPQPFYFVWYLDFRGRAYPVGKLLQPQGQDASRALLRFDAQRPLGETGEQWLAIHGANMLGIEGRKRDERVEALYRRESQILAIAADPIGTTDLWLLDANGKIKPKKKAWRSLAFCIEWARMKRDGKRFESFLPVSMDGTCNAIQHFAAMLRDPALARLTNVLPGDMASDAYLEVAVRTRDAINRSPQSAEKAFLEVLSVPLDRLIDRDLCKQPVMTKSYGITKFGLTRQVREALKKRPEYVAGLDHHVRGIRDRKARKEAKAQLHSAVSRYIAELMHAEVTAMLVRADELMNWLQECAELLVANGKPIRWIAPNGFPVMQAYHRNKSKIIKTELSGIKRFKASALTLKMPTDELAMHKAINGIAANFVHSHDAAHMMLTTQAARREGIAGLRMIHDSFATHAGDAATLARILREEFVGMYQRHDVLADFHRECVGQLGAVMGRRLPNAPVRGSLNLECVLESSYFFS